MLTVKLLIGPGGNKMELCKHIVFNTGGKSFSIDISHVEQIIYPLEVFKLPNMPEYIEGLINLRGNVYTVLNLRRRLGMPFKKPDENTKVILVEANSAIIGITVDEVKEIVDFAEENFAVGQETSVADINPEFISNIIKLGEKIIIELNLQKLLALDS